MSATHVRTHRRVRLPGGASAILLLVFVFLCIAAPWIWGGAAEATVVVDANQSMSSHHLLGTDDLGRDLLARTLVATRSSLVLAVLATLVGGVIGIALGLLSGVSRRLGWLIGAVINLLIAFPGAAAGHLLRCPVRYRLGGKRSRRRRRFRPGFRPDHPDVDGVRGESRLRRRRKGSRPRSVLHRPTPHPAQHRRTGDSLFHHSHRYGDPVAVRAQFSGARGSAAVLRLGSAAQRRTHPGVHLTGCGARSGRRHRARRPGLQHGRRAVGRLHRRTQGRLPPTHRSGAGRGAVARAGPEHRRPFRCPAGGPASAGALHHAGRDGHHTGGATFPSPPRRGRRSVSSASPVPGKVLPPRRSRS